MIMSIDRARLVHHFLSAAIDSPHGAGLVGAQVVGDEIIAFVEKEENCFAGTFGEFKLRSVVVGEIEVCLSNAAVACLPDAKDDAGANPA